MTDVAYKAWYLISVDTDPAVGRDLSPQPPMMTTMAVDAGSSLVFLIEAPSGALDLAVTATGFSAEGRGEDALEVYLGEQIDGSFDACNVTWERGQDEANAVFRARLSRSRRFIKLRVPGPPALVVVRVDFST